MGTLPSLTQPCRYDSLTGVPAQQRALAFEKGSVLFNIGALHTQIGARQDRSCPEGTSRAAEAFRRAAGEGSPDPTPRPWAGGTCLHVPCSQVPVWHSPFSGARAGGGWRACAGPLWGDGVLPEPGLWCVGAGWQPAWPTVSAPSTGAFSLLRENFSRAPSPDMSPASLSMLEQLMTAQAQECVFEGLLLPAPTAPHNCLAQLYLAQEAAQVRVGVPCPQGDLDKCLGRPSPGLARLQ